MCNPGTLLRLVIEHDDLYILPREFVPVTSDDLFQNTFVDHRQPYFTPIPTDVE